MIGRKLLRCIDLRLRQAFPIKSVVPFGGISIYLMGDFCQLLPVLDKQMFDTKPDGKELSDTGRQSFKAFKKAVILTTVERVRGDDDAQRQFREMLLNIRNGTLTLKDYQLLMTRLKMTLPETDVQLFHDAPNLVADHNAEYNINMDFLNRLGQPICLINGVHSPQAASKGSSRDAMNLEPFVKLAQGAKVMLRSNIWVSAGLTNGSMGTVHGFLYGPDNAGPPALPAAVCVQFPSYRGPAWDSNNPQVVPVAPITAKWTHNSRVYSRTQIPLSLAFATTIHKSQGWTKPRVTIDIGKKEFAMGLSFVAFSRSKSLSGILINPKEPASAQWSRFLSINNGKAQINRRYIDDYMVKLSRSNN